MPEIGIHATEVVVCSEGHDCVVIPEVKRWNGYLTFYCPQCQIKVSANLGFVPPDTPWMVDIPEGLVRFVVGTMPEGVFRIA